VPGWLGGAAAGAAIGSVIPGLGTAAGGMVGGVIGALGGGIGGSSLAKTFVDRVAEDDHKSLLAIIEYEMENSPPSICLVQMKSSASRSGWQKVTPQYCAAFGKKHNLRTTKNSRFCARGI
jgi:outer membrane lipoprotein SlyB